MLSGQLGRFVTLPGEQRAQSCVHAVDIRVGQRSGQHGVDRPQDVVDVGLGGRRVREVEVPVGIGGSYDPVVAPRDDEHHRLLGAQDDRDVTDHPVPRYHHVHALGRAHPKSSALLGQRLDLVGPDAGRVDHDVTADLGDSAVLGIADAHAGYAVALAQHRDHLGGAAHDSAVMSGSACDGHGVPGVVNDGVVVANATDQRAAFEARAQPECAGAGQMLLCRNRFRAAELVVEEDARRDVRAFPNTLGQWKKEWQRFDQMGRQRGQRQLPFVERLAYQAEFQLFEIAQPTVEHFRGATRSTRGEVAGLDQRHLQPAGSGVQSTTGAHHAAADDHDVELLGAESLPGQRALSRSKSGSRPGLRAARCLDRVAHHKGLLTGETLVRLLVGRWALLPLFQG